MRRLLPVLVAFALVTGSCTSEEPRGPDGFRTLDPGQVQSFDVSIAQRRTATGPGSNNTFTSEVTLSIDEEAKDEDTVVVVVRDARAVGEQTQIDAAARLKGRRIEVDLRKGVVNAAEVFSGTQDVPAADIALLSVLLAPLLPQRDTDTRSTWRSNTQIPVPWSQSGSPFTIEHRVSKDRDIRGLHTASVASDILANVTFRIELVREVPPEVAQQEGGATSEGRGFIVNELFDLLFTDIDDPVHATVAAIAAIPLAVMAPFIALLEGFAGLFGGRRESAPRQPEIPVATLSGPLELEMNSDVWRHDGRVLGSTGSGSIDLKGTLPTLGGEAAKLSGQPLTMRSDWDFKRVLTSPYPDPIDESSRSTLLLVFACLIALAAIAMVMRSRRRAQKPPATALPSAVASMSARSSSG